MDQIIEEQKAWQSGKDEPCVKVERVERTPEVEAPQLDLSNFVIQERSDQ